MLELNQELVEYLSELSRIGLTQEEKENILADLQKIMTFFEELQKIDTEEVEPTYTIFADLTSPQREDTVCDLMPSNEFIKNAPSSLAGMITIPSFQ